MQLFEAGSVIERREVLHGRLWLSTPVTVVRDDGDILAVRLDPGAPMTFAAHPFGRHPWAGSTRWAETIVLQLYRPQHLYSVWKMFGADGAFRQWYINFEAPLARDAVSIDTDDYGLDIVIRPDGTWWWKDVPDLHHQRAQGRIEARTVLAVLEAAAQVEQHLIDGTRWWSDWDSWTPAGRVPSPGPAPVGEVPRITR
ncbi:DUF402 domain-containing protein [Flexivirga oryzae]|uniref:DUF402 domain-containing protein n=1 Tax=Flexivirga oryzae TaxID=1794944 RepID=A0A839NCQ2_9MICO|nr:DUF402 domain-containing protein [Flexivirga oryzae]MBB2894639.1 hypothetical protein [Flexivirga oryzae]